MRRPAVLLALFLLTAGVLAVAGAPATASAPSAEATGDVVAGSWIVELRPGQDPAAEAPRLARQHGGRAGHVYTAALSGFSFHGSDRAAGNLARNPKVRRVEPNRVVRATTTVPTGVRRIDSRDGSGTHTVATTGAGVRVAVLDTGVASGHTELSGRVETGKSCIATEPSATTDGNGHGTHVAGTVAGRTTGVAPGATIVPVKVLDSSGSGSWESVICGIDYVTANAPGIRIANMSLGGSSSESGGCQSSTLHAAICASTGNGVTYAVSSGNDGRNASGYVPAKYPEVLTVSAFSDLDGLRDPQSGSECVGVGRWKDCDETFAAFSNHGSIVDVMAPGVRIYSSVPGGYDTYSGTSMAAPHVAGVAALVVEGGAITAADLEVRLKATGECPGATWATSTGTCGGTWSGDGDGIAEPMVNAARAVSGSVTPTEPAPAPDPQPSDSYATATSYSPSGGPTNDKHMTVVVKVTSGGIAVAGATVVADITHPGGTWTGATATTDGAGNAVFSLRNTGRGCYRTDVTSVNGAPPSSEVDATYGCTA